MALYYMNGIDDGELFNGGEDDGVLTITGGEALLEGIDIGIEKDGYDTALTGTDIGRRTKAERKEARVERKEARAEKREERKESPKAIKRAEKRAEREKKGGAIVKIKKGVLKVGIAPARAAFLVIVKLNALKLATKLNAALKKDPKKVEEFWKKVGGKFDKLKEAISHGAKAAVKGIDFDSVNGEGYDVEIGSSVIRHRLRPMNINGVQVGSGVAAAIATATPIIVLVVKLLSDLKVVEPKDVQALTAAAGEGAKLLHEEAEVNEIVQDHKDAAIEKQEREEEEEADKEEGGFWYWLTHIFKKKED